MVYYSILYIISIIWYIIIYNILYYMIIIGNSVLIVPYVFAHSNSFSELQLLQL